jgi:hypothetical protein
MHLNPQPGMNCRVLYRRALDTPTDVRLIHSEDGSFAVEVITPGTPARWQSTLQPKRKQMPGSHRTSGSGKPPILSERRRVAGGVGSEQEACD